MAGRGKDTEKDGLLAKYYAKRDFGRTAEPKGTVRAEAGAQLTYMIQKHAATRLHYDFRLEMDGVLKSWAVTRGPSLDPADKRLAVHVEDHPLDYATFEGTIPAGEYGGGAVMLWDRGYWEPIGDARQAYRKGHLRFLLHGERLTGEWHLIRMHGHRKGDDKRENWLLIKGEDDIAEPGKGDRLLKEALTSIASGRDMTGIAQLGPVYGKKAAKKTAGKAAVAAMKETLAQTAKPRKPDAAIPLKPAGKRKLRQGKSIPLPEMIMPQLATLVNVPPNSGQWAHEIKFDGYRLLACMADGEVRLMTRTGQDWTRKFPSIASALEKVKVRNAWLDGEVVAMNAEGKMSFAALQKAIKQERDTELRYYLFDLLHLDGKNLRPLPLSERKVALAGIMPKKSKRLFYSESFDQPGQEVLTRACSIGMEGIISKRLEAAYYSGRGLDWVKSKCLAEQEFVIGGYTLQPKHPGILGALLIGYYEHGALHFAGKVGTGFTQDESRALMKRLKTMPAPASAFTTVPGPIRRHAQWVKPELVGQIRFTEWTEDGMLRHPSFQALREDKPAREVVREKAKSLSHRDAMEAKTTGQKSPTFKAKDLPVEAHVSSESVPALGKGEVEIILTHPDKILYPQDGITKEDLARYYQLAAPWILAQIATRPISLLRCPEGAGGKACFFQRHAGSNHSPYLHPVEIKGAEEDEPYLMIRDEAGLLSLVQMGVLEIHAWGAMAAQADRPDRLTFDLDPHESVPWEAVKDSALHMREILAKLGLESFLKSTGGKGLHIVAPIDPGPDWEEVKRFCQAIAHWMTEQEPARYTDNVRKAVRTGRIYIDYLRNQHSASAIAAYSTRARAGAPVAMPLGWDELAQLKAGNFFTLPEAVAHLRRRKQDPWAKMPKVSQKLPKL